MPSADALVWSPQWTVQNTADGSLSLSAGADRVLAVDGASDLQIAEATAWAAGNPVTDTGDPALGILLDRLVEIGAVVPTTATGRRVAWIGDAGVVDRLANPLTGSWSTAPEAVDATVTVVVRSDRDWPSPPTDRLHVGLDVSMHHTAVFGPLVVPGVTACIGCMSARTSRRWGVPAVPPSPAVHDLLPAVAALLRVQLALIEAQSSPLVNATIAWDFEHGSSDREKVFKLPGCDVCDRPGGDGRVELPWTA